MSPRWGHRIGVLGICVLTLVAAACGGSSVEEQAHGITQQQFNKMPEKGITRAELLEQLGKPPADWKALVRKGWAQGEAKDICPGTEFLAYFALEDDRGVVFYGFCFYGDTLEWKSSYTWGD